MKLILLSEKYRPFYPGLKFVKYIFASNCNGYISILDIESESNINTKVQIAPFKLPAQSCSIFIFENEIPSNFVKTALHNIILNMILCTEVESIFMVLLRSPRPNTLNPAFYAQMTAWSHYQCKLDVHRVQYMVVCSNTWAWHEVNLFSIAKMLSVSYGEWWLERGPWLCWCVVIAIV